MELRDLRDGDEAALARLWQACGLTVWYNDPAEDIARYRAAGPTARILVLDDGTDELAGSVCAGSDGHRGWIYYLAVRPDLQRHGLGARLVAAAEDFVRGLGIAKIQLMVRPSNRAVGAFYRALGYDETPRRIFARWLVPPEQPPRPENGTISVVITYLEMLARPSLKPVAQPRGLKLALMRAERPSVDFYRFLYNGVGRPWNWWVRRDMGDDELNAILQDPRVEVFVLYVDGQPAGYAELDRRPEGEVDLAYFGLLPQFTGRGLGAYLLTWTIERAWSYGPSRLSINTCTLDSPKALTLYQRLGFVPYKQETVEIEDPGLLP